MTRRAFTLVELLVVISIIALMSTIAAVSLSSARAQARNTKRIADIRQLVTAFGFGFDANGAYPSSGGNFFVCISSSCYDGWSSYPTNNGTVNRSTIRARNDGGEDRHFVNRWCNYFLYCLKTPFSRAAQSKIVSRNAYF